MSFEVGSQWSDATGSYFTADVTVTNEELSSGTTIAASPLSWTWPGGQTLMGTWDATAKQSNRWLHPVRRWGELDQHKFSPDAQL